MVVIVGDGAEWIWNPATWFIHTWFLSTVAKPSISGMQWNMRGSLPVCALDKTHSKPI
jgi:hypothetical protein